MNFIFDYLMTEGQRERLEKSEAKAAKAIRKEYDAMKAAAAVYLDETGDELQALIKAAEEAEKDPKSEYRKHAAKLAALEAKRDKARFALYGEFMAEYLATVGTDPAGILADFSDRVKLFIDASEETDPEAIRAAITAELLPYYAEALANTGTENAVTQLHNIVIAQLHNAAELPADNGGADPERLPVLKPAEKLKTVLLMRDKVISEIVKASGPEFVGLEEEENGQLKMSWIVKQDNRNPEINTFMVLRLDPKAGAPNLSGFEIAIIESIATRYRIHKKSPAGRTGGAFYIAPSQILADITGAPDLDPHKEKLDEIRRTVDRLSTEVLTLDFAPEVAAGRIQPDAVKSATSRATILKTSYRKVILANGAQKEVYKIDDEPEIFTYCAAKGHLTGINAALLDVSAAFKKPGQSGRLACDPEVIAIKFYLLKEIYAMYEGNRRKCEMLYETIAKQAGVVPEKKYDRSAYKGEKEYKTVLARQDKRNRERVAAILDAWTARGFIKAFSTFPEGSTKPRGVTVQLYAKNPYQTTGGPAIEQKQV